VGGVKVGIVGMAYQWTAKTGDRSLTEGWSFGIKEREVQEHVRELREKEKVDLVLLLSHMGLPTDMKFASRVQGIDAVIGAHTHDLVKVPIKVGGTLVCQAGSHGKNLGRLDLTVRNGKVVKHDHEVYRIAAKEVKADQIRRSRRRLRAVHREAVARDRTDEDDDLAARDLAEPDGQLHQ
jgi:sulfur-oxidizing protein SoxB